MKAKPEPQRRKPQACLSSSLMSVSKMGMGSKYASVGVSYMLLLMMASSGKSDMAKDREECANQLVGLATCLPYVGGTAKAPTPDCCTGLKQVLDKSKKCLCILIKDRNDPSLGLNINATIAMSLPDTCHAPANVSKCPELLHLPPNSPDAQVFEQFANSSKGNINSTVASGNQVAWNSSTGTAQEKSGGGREKRIMVVDTVSVVWLGCLGLASFLIIDVWK